MSPSRRLAIVRIPAADVRREPRHAAELRNQLLLGEAVRIESSRGAGEWQRVRGLEDGYAGWVRSWALHPASAAEVGAWERGSRRWFGAPIAWLEGLAPGGPPRMPLFFGSRLRPLRGRGRRGAVALPDGRRGRIDRGPWPRPGAAVPGLVARLGTLMGVPYLWGGRTPAGLDCSGLTQLVFAERGVTLPRDARDQFRRCPRPKPAESPRLGDLVFFARPGEEVSHVGIMTGECSFVHSRGVVHEASLDPSSPLYDKRLATQLRGFGRPVPGP